MKDLAPLLQALADKLGTTTQYLWNILVQQAPIQATIIVVQIVVLLLFCAFLFRLHKKFLADELGYDFDDHPIRVLGMIIGAIIAIVLLVTSFFYLPDIINGYFHPEYWALDHILNALSTK
jgi:heme/copper-type cytochrome/quinol oxidase subunit 2